MAKVWKRKDRDIWIVDYRDASGTRKRVVGGTTREEAELVSAQLTIQLSAEMKKAGGPVRPGQDLTLNDYAETWLRAVKPHLAQRTHASYAHLYTLYIRPTLGAMTLRALRRGDLAILLAEKRLTVGKNTVRLIKATLSTMLSQAVEDEILPLNVALGRFKAQGNARTGRKKIRALSRVQLAHLTQTMETLRHDGRLTLKWLMLFTVMAGTGLRPSEALALQPGDVDMLERTLHVDRALDADGSVKPTKMDETRTVDLSDGLMASLTEYLTWLTVDAMAQGREALWLFPDDAGRVLNAEQIRYMFQWLLKKAGLPKFTPYDLRHTFASLRLSMNVPLLYVAKMLGDDPKTILKYYAHWMPSEDDRHYANLFDAPVTQSEQSETWHLNVAPKTEVVDSQGENADLRLIVRQPNDLIGEVLCPQRIYSRVLASKLARASSCTV